jgi:hypothetical protein
MSYHSQLFSETELHFPLAFSLHGPSEKAHLTASVFIPLMICTRTSFIPFQVIFISVD